MFFGKQRDSQSPDSRAEELQVQEERLMQNLSAIQHRMVVFSGKGGVGKTTVAVNLAFALGQRGLRVGLIDADVTGPNVPKMIGLSEAPMGDESGIIPLQRAGLKVISIGFMIDELQPVIWRGPMRSGLLRQFLADVRWGELDFLIADLPPGTGDEVLTMAQSMRPDMAIIVTTPQEIALVDTRRATKMALALQVPHLGIVENMSGLTCPNCGYHLDIFDTGGGQKEAQEMGVEFFGNLPIDVEIRKGADRGSPVVLRNPDSESAKAFQTMADAICRTVGE